MRTGTVRLGTRASQESCLNSLPLGKTTCRLIKIIANEAKKKAAGGKSKLGCTGLVTHHLMEQPAGGHVAQRDGAGDIYPGCKARGAAPLFILLSRLGKLVPDGRTQGLMPKGLLNCCLRAIISSPLAREG